MEFPLLPHPDDENTRYPDDQKREEWKHFQEYASFLDPAPDYRQKQSTDCKSHRPERPSQSATKKVAPPFDLPPVKLETRS